MNDTTNLPPLPEPFTLCYEWDGPYGTRKFSAAAHNGRGPDRAVAIYTAAQVEEIRRAAILQERERCAKVCEEVAMPVENHEGKIWWNAAVGQCTAAIWEGDK